MPRTNRYKVSQVVRALHAAKGTMSQAARILQCSHTTVESYVRRYPACRAALLEERTENVDLAELKLREAMLRGEPWAVQFTLERMGRDRGWGRQVGVEHSGPSGGAIQVEQATGPLPLREIVLEVPALPGAARNEPEPDDQGSETPMVIDAVAVPVPEPEST